MKSDHRGGTGTNRDPVLQSHLKPVGVSHRKWDRRTKQWYSRDFRRHSPSGIEHRNTSTMFKRVRAEKRGKPKRRFAARPR